MGSRICNYSVLLLFFQVLPDDHYSTTTSTTSAVIFNPSTFQPIQLGKLFGRFILRHLVLCYKLLWEIIDHIKRDRIEINLLSVWRFDVALAMVTKGPLHSDPEQLQTLARADPMVI